MCTPAPTLASCWSPTTIDTTRRLKTRDGRPVTIACVYDPPYIITGRIYNTSTSFQRGQWYLDGTWALLKGGAADRMLDLMYADEHHRANAPAEANESPPSDAETGLIQALTELRDRIDALIEGHGGDSL